MKINKENLNKNEMRHCVEDIHSNLHDGMSHFQISVILNKTIDTSQRNHHDVRTATH